MYWNTHSRSLDLVGDHRGALSIILVGNQAEYGRCMVAPLQYVAAPRSTNSGKCPIVRFGAYCGRRVDSLRILRNITSSSWTSSQKNSDRSSYRLASPFLYECPLPIWIIFKKPEPAFPIYGEIKCAEQQP